MADVLVIATRKKKKETELPSSVQFVNLYKRPTALLESVNIAKQIKDKKPNSDYIANSISAPLSMSGCAGIKNESVAHAMIELYKFGKLKLPREKELTLPMVRLKELGKRGAHILDITGEKPSENRPYRGPFVKSKFKNHPTSKSSAVEYPALWNHSVSHERHLIVYIDGEGIVHDGYQDSAINLWNKIKSRLHISVEIGLNSASLASCLTPEESIGGRAWPNYILKDTTWEIPIVLWTNTTIGIMSFWWIGTRQQMGRVMLPVSQQPQLLVLNPRKLSSDQINACKNIFNDIKDKNFLPINESYRDPVREELDWRVLTEVLGFSTEIKEEFDLLRLKWCEEPSVHSGKQTAPRTHNYR